MNKNIYEILNNTHSEDAEYEHLSDMEVNDIMKRLNVNTKEKTMNRRIKKFIAGSAAIAACLTAFLIPVTLNSNNTVDNVGIADNSAAQKNRFFLLVDAAEIEADKAFGIDTANGDGEFPFSGYTFSINGTNIKNVSLSIDKGELYKSYLSNEYTENSEKKTAYSDSCTYIGSKFTEAFDKNNAYGFYLSEEIYENSDGDIKNQWHSCLDEFDGAALDITVEFDDGQKENACYELTSGMLELDKETMKPNGNFSDGSTPYIYGIYFEPKNN